MSARLYGPPLSASAIGAGLSHVTNLCGQYSYRDRMADYLIERDHLFLADLRP